MDTFSVKEYKTRIACCKTSNHHNSVPNNVIQDDDMNAKSTYMQYKLHDYAV